MEPVTREELENLIQEAKDAGKDTSSLEALLEPAAEAAAGAVAEPVLAEPEMRKEKQVGERVIVSTGPAREEDFK
jgi:hypothetical protein